MPQESQPGRTTRVLCRPVVTGENPANDVFVDLDVERQGDLLCDSRTAPVGITLLHFDPQMDECLPEEMAYDLDFVYASPAETFTVSVPQRIV